MQESFNNNIIHDVQMADIDPNYTHMSPKEFPDFVKELTSYYASGAGSGSSPFKWQRNMAAEEEYYHELNLTLMNAGIGHYYGELAANSQHQRQKELNKILHEQNLHSSDPGFIAKRLMAAGFNPALAFQQGIQGTPGASAPQAAGAGRPFSGGKKGTKSDPNLLRDILGLVQTMGKYKADISLLESQKENIDADTNLKNKEAGLTEEMIGNIPFDRAIKEATFKFIAEQTETESVKREGMEIGNDIQRIKSNIEKATEDYQIKIIERKLYTMGYEMESLIEDIINKRRNNEIGEKTANAIITKAFMEITDLASATRLKEAQINNYSAEQEIARWRTNIEQGEFLLEQWKAEVDRTLKQKEHDRNLKFVPIRAMEYLTGKNIDGENTNKTEQLDMKPENMIEVIIREVEREPRSLHGIRSNKPHYTPRR